MKVCSIVGTRPNFVKLAPLSRSLREGGNKEIIIHTGQHYDEMMSDTFFKNMHIPTPDYNLGVKEITHSSQIGNMMIRMEPILKSISPDIVIVYGDTNSTLAGAISASKLHIPLIHIEAGCRSYDMRMPEESNRVMVDHISDTLYAPTHLCQKILEFEHVYGDIEFFGDVMVDSLHDTLSLTSDMTPIKQKYVLLTVHRESNTNSIHNIREILDALNNYDYQVIFPVHPRTNKLIQQYNLKDKYKNIIFIDPMSYTTMIYYIKHASIIITDSGGVQKEAYLLNVPCITLRDTTEWVETLEYGWNQLIPVITKENILNTLYNLKKPSVTLNIFGNIGVCDRIVDSLMEKYKR